MNNGNDAMEGHRRWIIALNSSRSVMAVLIAVFLVVAAVTSAPSYGAIVGTPFLTFNGNGDGEINDVEDDEFEVKKTYEQVGPIFLEFTVLSTGEIEIEELIRNETRTTWIDFHFEIVAGNAVFSEIEFEDPDPFPFPNVNRLPDTKVWLSGGTVAHDEEFELELELEVLSLSGFFGQSPSETIRIKQIPSVPIPAALWLFASGLLVFIGAARRRKVF